MNFDEIVHQSESLVNHLDEETIPHVHKNIEHLRHQKDKLSSRVSQKDIKAAKLLGNKVGYELSDKLCKTLERIDTISTYEKMGNINTEDIPSFLKNQRENAILSAFTLTKNNSLKDSYCKIEKAKGKWWNTEKNNIFNVLMNAEKLPQLLQIGSENSKLTQLSPVSLMDGDTRLSLNTLNKEEREYALSVSEYVNQLLEVNDKASQPIERVILCPMLTSKSSELNEIYRLTNKLCQLDGLIELESSLEESRISNSVLSNKMLQVSIDHLEEEFFTYIQQYITTSMEIDNSFTDIRKIVGKFVQSLLVKEGLTESDFEDGFISGAPIWPFLYTCLRSGLVDVAVDIAKESSGVLGTEFVNLLIQFASIDCGDCNAFDASSIRRLSNEYKRSVRACHDSYKRLMYCLVSQCDLEDNHTRVLTSVDDYLWYRLCLTKYGATGLSSSSSNLSNLQQMLLDEYGEQYFQAEQHPLSYCKLLLLCQQLECACVFLARHTHLLCHSVHLAISLWSRNLLLISESESDPLLSTDRKRVNITKLISLYTTQRCSVNVALDLFYLVRELQLTDDDNDYDIKNGFILLASRLVINDADIVNKLDSIPLNKYGGNENAKLIMRYVAQKLYDKGELEAACEAYRLCGQYDKAAQCLDELLSTNLTNDRLTAKATSLQQYSDQLQLTLTLATFIQQQERDPLSSLALLDADNLLIRVSQSFDSAHKLPIILNYIMLGLRRAAQQVRARHVPMDHSIRQELRQRAVNLVVFVGQMSYRMPAELYASLSQLEMDVE